MLDQACTERKNQIRELWKEAQELTLIFGKIVSKLNN
jgi:hypothetical protein